MTTAALSALLNLVLLAGIPFLCYSVYQSRWRKRPFRESARRAGLQIGERRYIGYSLVFALASVVALVVWPPPVDALVRKGSAFRQFDGVGMGMTAVAMALLHGVVATGFTEELLFRGLIAGSLSRRLPIVWANVGQAVIFLVPHLFAVAVMPEMWGVVPVVLAGALVAGWLRIRSGSIVGPWLIHASVNVMTALGVAIRTAA